MWIAGGMRPMLFRVHVPENQRLDAGLTRWRSDGYWSISIKNNSYGQDIFTVMIARMNIQIWKKRVTTSSRLASCRLQQQIIFRSKCRKSKGDIHIIEPLQRCNAAVWKAKRKTHDNIFLSQAFLFHTVSCKLRIRLRFVSLESQGMAHWQLTKKAASSRPRFCILIAPLPSVNGSLPLKNAIAVQLVERCGMSWQILRTPSVTMGKPVIFCDLAKTVPRSSTAWALSVNVRPCIATRPTHDAKDKTK